MIRISALSAAAMITALGAAAAETKTYDLKGFDGVSASAGVEVEVEVGGDYAVTLETSGDVDAAVVRVDGDMLVLSRERMRGISLGSRGKMHFTVSMPSFEEGKSSSGADLSVSGIDGGNVTLGVSSGADLKAGGECDKLEAEASSGADLSAADLRCDSVEASASSGASVRVHADDSIKARASSGGSIRVGGDPDRRDTKTSSGGSVRVR
jgi:hypothetical protein